MEREKRIYKVTLIGGAANVVLLAFKFVAGILAGSAAMIADAVHSFSDFITDVIVLVFVKISSIPADDGHDYGHGKYETLATTIIGIALLGVAIGIICSGAKKIGLWLSGEQLSKPGLLALWAAIASIVVKELVYRYTIRESDRLDSPALKANAWHHRSDALSSVGTAIGIGGAILLGDRWAVLDPLASIIVGGFIVKVGVDLTRNGVGELMERSLPREQEDEIIRIVESVPGVGEPHNLRTRRIGTHYAIDMHIRMDGKITLDESHALTTLIENNIRERFGEKTFITIHTEPFKK